MQETGKREYIELSIKTYEFVIIVDRGGIYAAPPFRVNEDDSGFVPVMLAYL